MPDLGGYIWAGAIYEPFSVCVQMSRNVVVSFAEGYSDVLDDKKNRELYDFLQPIRGLYSSRGYIRAWVILGLLQYSVKCYLSSIKKCVRRSIPFKSLIEKLPRKSENLSPIRRRYRITNCHTKLIKEQLKLKQPESCV